jgi:hypothetical protein
MTPYLAKTSLGMPPDTKMENRRRHKTTFFARMGQGTPMDVATLPQDATFGTDEPRDVNGHDRKQMPSVATPPKTPHLPQVIIRMPLETML